MADAGPALDAGFEGYQIVPLTTSPSIATVSAQPLDGPAARRSDTRCHAVGTTATPDGKLEPPMRRPTPDAPFYQ